MLVCNLAEIFNISVSMNVIKKLIISEAFVEKNIDIFV